MEREVVERRKWLSSQRFLDLVGATNLIPGPNSTELAIHIGYAKGGWRGLGLVGTCFILPAVVLTMAIAWAYVTFGTKPELAPILSGVKPAVIAIIVSAAWKLGKKAVKNVTAGIVMVGVAALVPYLATFEGLQAPEVLAFFIGGAVGWIALWFAGRRSNKKPGDRKKEVGNALLPLGLTGLGSSTALASTVGTAQAATASAAGPAMWQVGLFFLKIGSILYGSGYVLFAYLKGNGWLSEAQVVDAVAVGQLTPGPILSTATFVGFVVASELGLGMQILFAVVATLGIFLPSFVFVGVIGPLVPKLRKHPLSASFLDAVNAASMGLLAAVTFALSYATFVAEGGGVAWMELLIFAGAATLVLALKASTALIVLGGAAAGWLIHLFS